MVERDSLPLPGLDVVGRGLYLRPHAPYELKRQLFRQDQHRRFYSRETDRSYLVPRGYEVDESPPPPNGVALNKITIEESWERFSRARALDYGMAAGWLTFNIDLSAHLGHELRSELDAYYGVRSSFVALWSVYLEDPSSPSEAIDASELPAPFTPEHRHVYDAFFERYGTHFVKRAWVGGKAEVLFSLAKSAALSREDINAGLRATAIPSLLGGSTGSKLAKQKALVQSHSRCTVIGRGGDELKLAALSSLDEAAYNAWLETIKINPQTVELGIAGIWTLVGDPQKRAALRDAYRAAAVFAPISAMFRLDDCVYFTRGRELFGYALDRGQATPPQLLSERWPALAELGFATIDTAFAYDKLVSASNEPLGRKLFLLHRDEVLRFDVDRETVDPGYPRKIAQEWPGVEFEKIDAIMATSSDAMYLFSGSRYVRVNPLRGCVDEGYPDLVSCRWLGVTFDRIDAAMQWSEGKVYFVRGDQLIRYDTVTLRADPAYPKPIIGGYIEDWSLFE